MSGSFCSINSPRGAGSVNSSRQTDNKQTTATKNQIESSCGSPGMTQFKNCWLVPPCQLQGLKGTQEWELLVRNYVHLGEAKFSLPHPILPHHLSILTPTKPCQSAL